MSYHRENALAFGLTRALALMDKLRPGSSMGPAAEAWTEVEEFKAEMGKLLSVRHTLRNPSTMIPGLTDVKIIGAACGWLIELFDCPTASLDKAGGEIEATLSDGMVTLCRRLNDEEVESTHTAIFFRLFPDPMAVTQKKDPRKVAEAVGNFVDLVLKTKGLDDWYGEVLIFRGSTIAMTHITFERDTIALR